jgi:hypothetical protein
MGPGVDLTPMRRVTVLPVLIVGLAVGVAGCGPESDTGIPTASGSSSPSAGSGELAPYVACIREHGVAVPDPPAGVQVYVWIREQAEANAEFDPADRACRQLLPPDAAEETDGPSAEVLEALRGFAVCMRDHDIEISDPLPDGNLRIGGRLEGVTRAQLEADPAYVAAMHACEDKLPAEGEKE